jgi:hypothetical protein
MESNAKSFIEAFRRVYESAKQHEQDQQSLMVYYTQGIDRIRVEEVRKSRTDDNILIINGSDSSGNHCVVIARIEAIDFVMKLEQKEENKEYLPVKIGF